MTQPTLLWFRRDLRLEDNAALLAACAAGGPVVPVFIYDETVERLGPHRYFDLALQLKR